MPTSNLTVPEFQQNILDYPQWYIEQVLGQKTWPKEVEIVHSMLHKRRTAVRGCVSSGKTFAAALGIFAFMHAYAPAAEVYTTAPTYRQVNKFLWKEVRKIHKASKVPLQGVPLDTPNWKLAPDWFATGFAPKDAESVRGAHARNILVIIDEAQGVAQSSIENLENALAGGNCHLVMLFNPNARQGEEAYEAFHSKAHIYHPITIDADSTPNIKQGRTVINGMIEKQYRDELVSTYGWDSNVVRVNIRALYPKQDQDAVIPIDWIEKAMCREREPQETDRNGLGVDVARFGMDDSCIASAIGRVVQPLETVHGKDTVEVSGLTNKAAKKIGASSVCIDEIGVGSGVVDICRDEKVKGSRGINVANKARNSKKFADLRSELWWNLRESLDPNGEDPLCLPRDLKLQGDLSSVHYSTDKKGRIKVESKDEIRARLGRSPDRGDAVVLVNHAIETSHAPPGGAANPGSGSRISGGGGSARGERPRRRFSEHRPFGRLRDRGV